MRFFKKRKKLESTLPASKTIELIRAVYYKYIFEKIEGSAGNQDTQVKGYLKGKVFHIEIRSI